MGFTNPDRVSRMILVTIDFSPFASVEMLRKDALFSLVSSMIFLLYCFLPSAALSMLTPYQLILRHLVPASTEATQTALIRRKGWNEDWYLPINPSKCEASFFFVELRQASHQIHLSLLNIPSALIPLKLFLRSP